MSNNKFNKNPFRRQALKDDSLLSGKKHSHSLDKIRKYFNQSYSELNCPSLLIKGDRGTGKTSLLKILENDNEKYNYYPVSLFLTESTAKDEISFFQGLYNNLFHLCKEHDILIEEITDAEKSVSLGVVSSNYDYWVFEFIGKLIEYKANPSLHCNLISEDIVKDLKLIINQFRRVKNNDALKIIFFMDEAQLIFSNRNILEIIRHIIQEEIGITFVLASQDQIDEKPINDVFDNLNRAFKIFNLGYFETTSDISEFLKKSLYKVGWREKDLRLYINNYDKLLNILLKLTSGKPEFVNRIADEMFTRVMNEEDSKMRLNDEILIKIALDIEKQNTASSPQEVGSFNLARAEKIISLSDDEFQWFKFICSSQIISTPNNIFKYLKVFANETIDSLDEFKNFIDKLLGDNILFIGTLQHDDYDSRIGFRSSNIQSINPLEMHYLYPGSNSEKIWISLMLQTKSKREIKFVSQPPWKTLLDEIMKIAGSNGSMALGSKDSHSNLFSSAGFGNSNFENSSFKDFFQSLKSNKIDVDGFSIEVIEFLLEIISSNIKDVYFISLSLNLSNFCISQFLYIDGEILTSIDSRKVQLNDIAIKLGMDSVKFEFVYEKLVKEDLIDYKKFEELILSSNNAAAKNLILFEASNKASDLYLADKGLNHSEIMQRIECVYQGIRNGNEVKETSINNAGYMFMNLKQNDKAEACFKYILDRFNLRRYDDKLEEVKDSIFLSMYNYSILLTSRGDFENAIKGFQEALEFSDLIKDNEFSALNTISFNDENKMIEITEDTNNGSIDIKAMINSNLKILKAR